MKGEEQTQLERALANMRRIGSKAPDVSANLIVSAYSSKESESIDKICSDISHACQGRNKPLGDTLIESIKCVNRICGAYPEEAIPICVHFTEAIIADMAIRDHIEGREARTLYGEGMSRK